MVCTKGHFITPTPQEAGKSLILGIMSFLYMIPGISAVYYLSL
jgi:hypothetical protein